MNSPWAGQLGALVLIYPLGLSLIWCLLALLWSWRCEWPERWQRQPPASQAEPPVSVLIPCFNEGPNLRETLQAALDLVWGDWEVIAINDGSSDDTGPLLEAMARVQPRLRVVHLASNQGKALALRAMNCWCASMGMRCWTAMPWAGWCGTFSATPSLGR